MPKDPRYERRRQVEEKVDSRKDDRLDEAALAAIASAALYSVSNLVIKMLARTEDTTTITLYGNVIMLPLALLPLLFDWRWPSVASVPWIIALGVCTTLGQWALARAIASADARVVWPFDFLRLPFTVVIGRVDSANSRARITS